MDGRSGRAAPKALDCAPSAHYADRPSLLPTCRGRPLLPGLRLCPPWNRKMASTGNMVNRVLGQFAYIQTTFPLVSDPAKPAAHKACRDVERGVLK